MQPHKAIYRNSVTDFWGKRVTKWYVFGDEVTNGFEGRGLLRGLGTGRKTVKGERLKGAARNLFGRFLTSPAHEPIMQTIVRV